MTAKSKYPPGTIGYASDIGEQEGRDAWLAGIAVSRCPYSEDIIGRAAWLFGWYMLDNMASQPSDNEDGSK